MPKTAGAAKIAAPVVVAFFMKLLLESTIMNKFRLFLDEN
jgi:hypothetical protein